MLLSHKTSVKLNKDYSNIIGHMCYASPDWYYQKKAHKDDIWYKNLPSQTAQEVCKLLDKSWKSFYKLTETHGIANPHPPKFKHSKMPVTYMQNGIVHMAGLILYVYQFQSR